MISKTPDTDPHLSLDNRQLLDLLPLGSILLDADLVILSWNRTVADWTSITAESAIGQRLTDLFPNVANRQYAKRLQQVFSTGMPATYSPAFHRHFLPVPARHGFDNQLMIQETVVRLVSREPAIALITLQDVSLQYIQLNQVNQQKAALLKTREKLENAVESLRETNQDLDEFNYIASHDLQAPLAKIINFGWLLEESCGGQLSEEGKRSLEVICDSSRRMRDLISDLLSLSQAGRSQPEYEPVNVNECVHGVLELLGHRIETAKAEIEVADLPTVTCDRRLVSQLFQNLIENGLKFVADGLPRLSITADRLDNAWKFGVKDNGIGIDSKASSRIFQPFQQLNPRKDYYGTGIGLSICKKAVQRHGGEIWVESRPGEGAHFLFTIPDGRTSDAADCPIGPKRLA
jgi:signal transduction histidine kinase